MKAAIDSHGCSAFFFTFWELAGDHVPFGLVLASTVAMYQLKKDAGRGKGNHAASTAAAVLTKLYYSVVPYYACIIVHGLHLSSVCF